MIDSAIDATMTPEQELLATIRKRFNLCETMNAHNRTAMVEDVRFARLGDQWPEAAKRARSGPGHERPMLVVNRLLQFRDRVVNEIRQNTPSIRIRPVSSGADAETADVLMGIVRHIQDNSNASIAYDTAVEWQVDAGLGFIRVRNDWADDDSFDQDIFIDRVVNPLSVYHDPNSKQPDGSDAEWCIIAEEITRDEFKRLYPNVDVSSWSLSAVGDAAAWLHDDAVRIAEYYWIERIPTQSMDEETGMMREREQRVCRWVKVSAFNVLESGELPTRYIPIVPVLGHEVWIDGKRHLSGLVRNAKDAQRLYNYYLSANAENVALSPKSPFVGVSGQFESDPNWARANQDSLAYLEYDPVTIAGTVAPPPQRAMPPQASPALLTAIQLAEQDIMQSMGIYQPSLGGESNETSGRALLLRQKQSEIGNFHYQDNLSRSIRHVGRIILDMIPHVYSRARVIRILGEDGSVQQANLDPSLPQASAYTDNPAVDSIYNPTIGTYDVVCDAGPSYATKRDESANMMLMLTQANPALFQIIGDLMLKNMDWPGADEISKRLQSMLPPHLQPSQDGTKTDPMVIQAQQMVEQMANQMEQMSMQIQMLRDERMLEIQTKEREWFDSQTKRMQVEGQIMMTDAQLQSAIKENLMLMLGQEPMNAAEENAEFEELEDNTLEHGHPPSQQQGMPQRPQSPGSMTRKADVSALTGETKPGESNV